MRFSVIIPTYLRRDIVLSSVRSLARQEFNGDFEVIVVVDGSEDDTAQALREIDTPFQFLILEQTNSGAATARNRGAEAARGEILLFLDDDMEAHPRLLAEHDKYHRGGADMVLGHIPLHPESPSNFLSAGVGIWAEERAHRLSSPGATLTIEDMITGQLSVSREIFDSIGGFDTANFNRNGSFGDEDYDFCKRLQLKGYRIIFNPNAISWQKYVVTPRHYLKQWRQAGLADVAFTQKHPDQGNILFTLHQSETLIGRLIRRPIKWLVLSLVDMGLQGSITTKLFYWVREIEYWQGVRESGGIPQLRTLRVLAYHAISDLSGLPILEEYGVPADLFRWQLETLQKSGYQFVDADEFLGFLKGKRGLPKKSILLTFDDCYEDLIKAALPILKERGIPALAFAVSRHLGGANKWDEKIGAPQLRLLDVEGLRELEAEGVEIGAHSRTHRPLTSVPTDELLNEVAGSVEDLDAIGIKRPRFFSYPHGELDERVEKTVQESGIEVAFTVTPNYVRPYQNPYQIPRIEIFRSDARWKFRWKVATAGRSIIPSIGIRSLVQWLDKFI